MSDRRSSRAPSRSRRRSSSVSDDETCPKPACSSWSHLKCGKVWHYGVVYVPTRLMQKTSVVGYLIGDRGSTVKNITSKTGTTIVVCGRNPKILTDYVRSSASGPLRVKMDGPTSSAVKFCQKLIVDRLEECWFDWFVNQPPLRRTSSSRADDEKSMAGSDRSDGTYVSRHGRSPTSHGDHEYHEEGDVKPSLLSLNSAPAEEVDSDGRYVSRHGRSPTSHGDSEYHGEVDLKPSFLSLNSAPAEDLDKRRCLLNRESAADAGQKEKNSVDVAAAATSQTSRLETKMVASDFAVSLSQLSRRLSSGLACWEGFVLPDTPEFLYTRRVVYGASSGMWQLVLIGQRLAGVVPKILELGSVVPVVGNASPPGDVKIEVIDLESRDTDTSEPPRDDPARNAAINASKNDKPYGRKEDDARRMRDELRDSEKREKHGSNRSCSRSGKNDEGYRSHGTRKRKAEASWE